MFEQGQTHGWWMGLDVAEQCQGPVPGGGVPLSG